MVVRPRERQIKEGLTTIAKSQQNSTTMLLGLKDCKAGETVRGDDKIVVKVTVNGGREKCPHCGSAKLYGHGTSDPRPTYFTPG